MVKHHTETTKVISFRVPLSVYERLSLAGISVSKTLRSIIIAYFAKTKRKT